MHVSEVISQLCHKIYSFNYIVHNNGWIGGKNKLDMMGNICFMSKLSEK